MAETKAKEPIISSQASAEMGNCNPRKRRDQQEEKEGRMTTLLEENRKLHEIVSSLQMELHQQRSEVLRMSYIVEEEQRLVLLYRTRYLRLRTADLLSARRVEPT